MKYVRVDENNIVTQTQGYFEEGFIMAPDDVYADFIYDPVLNTFSPPPPPPLGRYDFENRLRNRMDALQRAKFQALVNAALALSPNYPGLPSSIADFDAILDGMTLPL